MIEYTRVERLTETDKIVIIGGGRSLEGFNFGKLHRQDCFIIAVNDSGRHVPFAHAWFTLDPWGLSGPQLPDLKFKGQLYAAVPEDFGTPQAAIRGHRIEPTAPIKYLRRLTNEGCLCEDPSAIYTGNSGYGALGLAYHMKPSKVLLLGIDGDFGYYYPSHKTNNNLSHLPGLFEASLPQLRQHGIRVINGSPNSSVTCFPRQTPDYAVREFLS